MKLKLLRQIYIMSKYTVLGIVLQAILATMLVAKNGNAQHKSLEEIYVTIDFENERLEDALMALEEKTKFSFVFNGVTLDKNQIISAEAQNASLASLLRHLSKDAKLRFKRVNENIFVSRKNYLQPAVTEIIENFDPTQTVITGKVTSADDGEVLPGVSILIKGTTTGTTTDFDGNYKLSVPETGILEFSYIGFKTQEVAIGSQSVINVKLETDLEQLEEVVVVGYGTQEKANLTGAVGVADGEVLANRPIVNVGEGLKGVIPNLNVNIRNGDPAEPIEFNIRGFESINGGQPLVLVDGVPMDLNKINPNDIESISVLKDAAASAVYGARAAFGVVLVTTKKGQGEKINVSFGAEFGMAKPILFIDPITDPYQFVLARNQANERTNGAPAYDQDYIDGTRRYSENPTLENAWGVFNGQLRHYGYNNYVNELITDFAPQQKYNVSVSGASDKSSLYASFGYLNKDGYLKNKEKNENFKRYNILLKGDFKVNNWMSLDSRALVTIEKSDKPHFYHWDVNINTSARQDPLDPIQFPDLDYYLTPGDKEDFAQYQGMYFGGTNFFPYLEDGGRQTWTRNDIVLTQGATLTPIKGLNIRGEFSANYRYRDFQDVQSKVEVISNRDLEGGLIIDNGFSGNDWINNVSNNDQYYVINTYADYTIDTESGHYVKAMVGFNQEWGRFQYIRARAYSLITPQITDLNATVGNQETYGGKEHTSLRGAFYRVNYIFKDKYLLELNGRYDGTSRFPKEDRFGFFPSFSVGWRISNEAFMSNTSGWLDNLKLRASYGTLGNQLLFEPNGTTPIYYPYIPTMGSGTSPYMMSSGSRTPYVSAAGLVSPTLTWETVISKNIGVDISVLNNRLDFSFDWYTRDTKDMLTDVEFPSILGTAAPKQNAADLQTKGWEIAATWKTRINSDWNYNITLALADNLSKITKYDNPTGALSEYYVGQVVADEGGERWGYETVGIFQTEAEVAEWADQSQLGANWRPGDIKYADLNGDGKINAGDNTLENPGDQKIIAYENPRYSYGLTGNVGWKGLTLNLFFQGVLKYDYWPPNGNWVAFYPFNAGHVENYYLTDTWSESNPNAYFAAPHISTNTKQNIHPQTRYVQNAAYIRLRNLTLAYNLPAKMTEKIGLGTAQIYFSGMNMWEYTKMRKPLDPEVRPTLTQEYYKQRIYSLGVQVSF
ncbi:SusC/RagA family TonB-linked outer membrane protein [Flexithrix dorotheae]|uniref:SusC/RagA family TonB-linked outer membrane protein n=1 Tax=Flexithrix dorotheae TaxID=70993 RepID=UPI00037DB4EF|nr:TonB-dependent receptor [Flexithrix dorotheae]